MTEQRLERLYTKLKSSGLDAFLVTVLPHIRYLSHFSGSNALCLITQDRKVFLTDGRYREQAQQEVVGFRIVVSQKNLLEEISRRKLLLSLRRIGIDANSVTISQWKNLKKLFPRVKFVPSTSIIEELVAVKDETEIGAMREAVRITDRVFHAVLERIKAGVRELDIAAEISYLHRKFGAEADAFEPIVASGKRGALPHARASAKEIRRGELVTLDFGCRVNGYHSDLTRTVAVGKPGREEKKIYHVVLEAQKRGIEAAVAGAKVKRVDRSARRYIKEQGYGKFFNHSLGHGLGLQVHEMPRVSGASKETLLAGNVITIEPGIYVPGVGGVRIEDDVVVRNGSCEVLNTSPKELLVL
jgi:Xaa-Pro aminopeptidase